MPEIANLSTDRSLVDTKVVAENDRLTRSQRQQATAEPEQTALSSAVRAGEMDDLALTDLERHSSEQRKSISESDCVTKKYGGLHGIAQC